MSKRYDVKTPRLKRDGSNYWFRVGTAFEDDKGITVYLDALPLPDKDGRVVMKLWEPMERDRPAPQSGSDAYREASGGRSMGDALEDSIPFGPEVR